ncbi:MAG TPA: penicillin acylase family protein, partial [Solirubrobacteraceae bacterium]|nr:penicillin acylase family protein [Solirubrobacteraceae bacterium]
DSDFFFQRVKDTHVVERLTRRRFPEGPSRDVRATVRGFVAGYNAYLRRTGRADLPDPRCRGKGWVRPITTLDVYRRSHQLAIRASSGNFVKALVAARPPAAGATAAAAAARPAGALPSAAAVRARLARDPVLGAPESLGSNAYAFGRDMTATGRGALLGNPHFPWHGSDRWYELQLTIPGELNVIGAALQGLPVVNIGFNRDVAWSHTVSTARRFTPYELRLAPGRPTTYLVDGRAQRMRERTVRVPVARGDVRRHTFYETRWGPVLDYPAAALTWTSDVAYALADVNWDSFRMTNQWAAYDVARSARGIERASARIQGNPWTNTIAADRFGTAYYGDDSVVPNVDAALQARCSAGAKSDLLLAAAGVVLLDGSRRACAWGRDRDAVAPGIFGPRNLPRLRRSDYVANANNSYWLANPRHLLRGYARIIGPEATARSLRTRLVFTMAEELRAAGTKVGLGTLRGLVFNDRNHSAELARDAVVAACRANPARALPDGRVVDVSQACDVLAGWDARANLDSRGEVLWRELWRLLTAAPVPWRTPFDPADPVGTPGDFDASAPAVGQALAGAVQDLRDKGLALDVALGDVQREPRGSATIPIHGCGDGEGCFNVISTTRDATGHYDPFTGSSFVMTAVFDAKGRPRGAAILSYSQSENPRSAHYADQTRLFSAKRWLPMRFTESQIRSDRSYRRTVVTAPR